MTTNRTPVGEVRPSQLLWTYGPGALIDLIPGKVHLMFADATVAVPNIQGGKVQTWGTSAAKQNSLVPSVPPVAQFVPGFDWQAWQGVSVPAATPAAIVARLATDRARAQNLADLFAEHLEALAVASYECGPDWCVDIHFAAPPDQAEIRARLAALAGDETARAFRFETIAARDWVAASLAGLAPVEAGRFIVHGAHDRDRIPVNRIAIEIVEVK